MILLLTAHIARRIAVVRAPGARVVANRLGHVPQFVGAHAAQAIPLQAGDSGQQQQAETDWVNTILKYAHARQPFLNQCTPGYYNNEGTPNERSARNSQFWRGPTAFIRLLDVWRQQGSLPGLDLTPLRSD